MNRRYVRRVSSHVTVVWYETSCMRPLMAEGRNVTVISIQVHFLRSYNSCKVQIGIGLMASSSGASRQLINVLNHSCLSMSITNPEIDRRLCHWGSSHSCFGATPSHTTMSTSLDQSMRSKRHMVWAKSSPGHFAVIIRDAQYSYRWYEGRTNGTEPAQGLSTQSNRSSTITIVYAVYFQQTTPKHSANMLSSQLQNIPRRKLLPGYIDKVFPIASFNNRRGLRYRQPPRPWWYSSHLTKSWFGWYGQVGDTCDHR